MTTTEILATILAIIITARTIMYIRRFTRKCYVCGLRIKRLDSKAFANGNNYHFECWAKVAREKVFGEKNVNL